MSAKSVSIDTKPPVIKYYRARKTYRLVSITLLLFSAFYYFYGNELMEILPKCIFHKITGLQCPACGSQRALYNLVHGNIIKAFNYNAPAALLFLILFAIYLRAGLYLFLKKHTPPPLKTAKLFLWCYLTILLITGIVRIIYL